MIWSRLWPWRPYRRVEHLADLGVGAADGARVRVEGDVEALEALEDPVSGARCVAIDYRAWPPSTTIGMDGGTAHGSRAYEVHARQAVDFVLGDAHGRVLVRVVPSGDDVTNLHRRLLARFGVGLRSESDVVLVGSRVCVAGRVVAHDPGASPHRRPPWHAELVADRLWRPT